MARAQGCRHARSRLASSACFWRSCACFALSLPTWSGCCRWPLPRSQWDCCWCWARSAGGVPDVGRSSSSCSAVRCAESFAPICCRPVIHWLFWCLFGAVAIVTPTFTLLTGPSGLRLSAGGHRAFTVLLVAAVAMAVLALLPRRQISLATNLLVAIGWSFLAVQLVGINRPPSDPVVIDWPLAGEWYVVHGGRSDLINAHYPSRLPLIGPEQADALDVLQVQNGRSFRGDSQQLTSYLAFGQPVLAPGDGMITDLADTLPG